MLTLAQGQLLGVHMCVSGCWNLRDSASARFLPGQQFSSCSAADLSASLLHGGGMCLFNPPQPERLLGGPRCGNLYVEKGEQCDCGLVQVTHL